MSWLEKLEDFIKVDLKNISLNLFNITIINKSGVEDKVNVDEDNKILSLNRPAFEDEEWLTLKQIFKEGFNEKELSLIETNSDKRIKDIQEKINLSSNKKILDFYGGKISNYYLEILEAALYLKSVFDEGSTVGELKRDIVRKYGDEGRNIANLCSAGYFEGYIKEVYDEMSFSDDFTMEKFQKYFEIIVRISPFAIFVSKKMESDELSGEIIHKIETHKKYGISFLAIHGLGKKNVKKILEIVHELEEEKNLDIAINQQNYIIFVKIRIE